MISKRIFIFGALALAGCKGDLSDGGGTGDKKIAQVNQSFDVIGSGKFQSVNGKEIKGRFEAISIDEGNGSWIWLKKNFRIEETDNLAVGLAPSKVGPRIDTTVREIGPLLGSRGPQGFSLDMPPGDLSNYAAVIVYSTSSSEVFGAAIINEKKG